MKLILFCVGLIALCGVCVMSAPAEDFVPVLPGFAKTLSKVYSGFLDIPGGKHLHYVLVESENNPATDPVVWWTNGGPGCSSMEGLLNEMGPYLLDDPVQLGPDGVPKMSLNPYRWTINTTFVAISAPAGVGYSYADTEQGYQNNDMQQGIDNKNGLIALYAKFPELLPNKLFLTGESYGGEYVPQTAEQVLMHNSAGKSPKMNLEGIMVGNGVTGQGSLNEPPIYVDFYLGHDLFPHTLKPEIDAACGNFSGPTSLACDAVLAKMHNYIGPINIYDIYKSCVNAGTAFNGMEPSFRAKNMFSRRPATEHEKRIKALTEATYGLGSYGPIECIDGGVAYTYMNHPIVRKALHVTNSTIQTWHICGGPLQYTQNGGSELPLYQKLVKEIRVQIYNGDVDACIPYIGNLEWTNSLGVPVKTPWSAWMVESNKVGGYITQFEGGFNMVTIADSGHMVPQWAPHAANIMFQNFIYERW